ncbi:MAG: hypothetical protein V1728_02565 [Candidatus Micrarchaeota archaeon]
MRLLSAISTTLYVLGMVSMLIGLVTLVLGVGSVLTTMKGQLNGIQPGTSAASPCDLFSGEGAPSRSADDLLSIVTFYPEIVVDNLWAQIGFGDMENDAFACMYHSLYRRFFAMLLTGLVLIILSLLFRAWDQFDKYLDDRGQAERVKVLEDKLGLKRHAGKKTD